MTKWQHYGNIRLQMKRGNAISHPLSVQIVKIVQIRNCALLSIEPELGSCNTAKKKKSPLFVTSTSVVSRRSHSTAHFDKNRFINKVITLTLRQLQKSVKTSKLNKSFLSELQL